MDEEPLEQIEQQLAAGAPCAPAGLRAAVLADVRRELRASRWDRWIARTAAAVLMLGVGLNAVNVLWGDLPAELGAKGAIARHDDAVRQDALVQAAAAVAEATDVETGRRVARQLAALGGRELSDEQAAAIDAAVRKHEG